MAEEYKIVDVRDLGRAVIDNNALKQELEKISEDGWELVTTDGTIYIFKRQKK